MLDLNAISADVRDQVAHCLIRLRSDFADGNFLREHFYNVDHSKLAGNTHHFWLRLALNPRKGDALKSHLVADVGADLPEYIIDGLVSELDQKVLSRLPPEYSTMVKVPFSITIENVAVERTKRIAWTIKRRIPVVTPYATIHQELNRMIQRFGGKRKPPNKLETEFLLTSYCDLAIEKSRRRYPELWDESQGHYVLDSRGSQFAKKLVKELESEKLLSKASKFVDVGSGVGTNVFAVNCFSDALATGVELHPATMNMSKVVRRRLSNHGILDDLRLELIFGDAFDANVVDLSRFDVIYVYSSLGKWELDIDEVVDRARVGAVILFNRLPVRNIGSIEKLSDIAGLIAVRKTKSNIICG